jgi:hypothetical protein
MLFENHLNVFEWEARKAIKQLFKNAIKNQTHDGDLFLVINHGFFHDEIESSRASGHHNLSPYVFGPGTESYSEDQSIRLFYRQMGGQIRQGDIDKFYQYHDSVKGSDLQWMMNVQLEMYMYLKFWEADMILKRLCQLVRLGSGLYYQWDLDLKKVTNRGDFIEKYIIADSEKTSPHFYQLISYLYDRVLRNAIAHSQYFFMGHQILLVNDNVHNGFSREEWDILINKFYIFYAVFNEYLDLVDRCYFKKTAERHFGQQVRIVKRKMKRRPVFEWIRAFDETGRYIWYKTWEKHYQPKFHIISS